MSLFKYNLHTKQHMCNIYKLANMKISIHYWSYYHNQHHRHINQLLCVFERQRGERYNIRSTLLENLIIEYSYVREYVGIHVYIHFPIIHSSRITNTLKVFTNISFFLPPKSGNPHLTAATLDSSYT